MTARTERRRAAATLAVTSGSESFCLHPAGLGQVTIEVDNLTGRRGADLGLAIAQERDERWEQVAPGNRGPDHRLELAELVGDNETHPPGSIFHEGVQ